MRAHDPAAAQGARRPREITLAKSEPGEDAFRFRLDFPVVLIFQRLVRLAAGAARGPILRRRRGLLREVAERDILLDRDFARVGRCVIENEREERRFAGAVRADKADAIAAVHLERDILEEDAPGERFADLRNGEHRGNGNCSRDGLDRKRVHRPNLVIDCGDNLGQESVEQTGTIIVTSANEPVVVDSVEGSEDRARIIEDYEAIGP